jgi:putative ABC transport system permease protein
VLFSVHPGLNGYKDARLVAYYEQLQQRLQSIPQVRAVGFSTRAPIGEGRGMSGATITDSDRPNESFPLHRHQVGPGYFEVFGIPIVSGRGIEKQDSRAAPKVIVVNETLVRRYFGNTNPIGRRLGFTTAGVFEIVGVARDVKYNGLRDEIPPTVYFSYQQFLSISNYMTFEVRADGGAAIVGSIRRAALTLDPDVPPVDIETQIEAIDKVLTLERTVASLSTWSGVLAVVLACVGLYGTMSFNVARRTNEIGVRLALGAGATGIRRMVLRETFVIIAAGLAVGLPLTFSAARLLKGQLFGLAPHDPTTMLLALIVLVTVTMVAGYVPARRASRVDPMIALRCG